MLVVVFAVGMGGRMWGMGGYRGGMIGGYGPYGYGRAGYMQVRS